MHLLLSSKRYTAAAFAAIFCSLAACDTATAPAADRDGAAAVPALTNVPVPPVTPAFQTRTPLYPAIAVYIVYREWVNRNPGLATLNVDDPKYQRYVEKRLRELYPNRGYAGMMRDAVAEARQNRAAWERHERELREYQRLVGSYSALSDYTAASTCGGSYVDPYAGQDESWAGQEEFAVPPDSQLPTIQMEIDSLVLVGRQVDDIYYYESLAAGTYSGGGGGGGSGGGSGGGGDDGGNEPVQPLAGGGSMDDLIRAAALGYTPSAGEVNAQVDPIAASALVGLGLIGWKAYRAATAHKLAIEKSTALYPNLAEGNTQRDAHRHIYWSMMLRRWIGKFLAKEVTDWHERNSSGGAYVMDLHNNDIGRTYRYHQFRGHWLWDRWDTSEWAVRVRDYINNESTNGEYIPEWKLAPPSTADARTREACVAAETYIFFSRDPS
ncbi:MAG TPA: hypothetical protein VEY93_08675 [Longimicrobium sp.]|nr:hypothetical protein [Longimicrobium sp.]